MTSAMKRRRAPDRSSAAGVLGCILALVHLSFSGGTDVLSTGSSSASSSPSSRPRITESTRKLAVVVPVYRGDLLRAVSSLEQWPTSCSPVTQQNVDLVLYYAESEADNSATAATAETIAKSAGRCFSSTQTVHADLAEEEQDIHQTGASAMFYKMFLDEKVRSYLVDYDALAIIEWDVLVATDRSFEGLYDAAFSDDGGVERFWVKGSKLECITSQEAVDVKDMWNVFGHINGNALYNNNDQAFVEYIDYTRARWRYDHPYDVSLWLTISDFPYSWPLWQRYSSKFVTTNMISYTGIEHDDRNDVSNANAGETLFFYGSKVDDANVTPLKATVDDSPNAVRTSEGRQHHDASIESDVAPSSETCSSACGSSAETGLLTGTSTVCDETCAVGRFGSLLCGAGDAHKYGAMCRLCYTDLIQAHEMERSLRAIASDPHEDGGEVQHVIMCDTMRPPEAAACSSKCSRKRNTVCDEACGTGRHGDYNCNWRNHGSTCRFCFDDFESALVADEVAVRHGGRVIMCSTLEPPRRVESQKLPAGGKLVESTGRRTRRRSRKLRLELSRDSESDGSCDAERCRRTNSDGKKGRICDTTCADGIPYGTYGCNAKGGKFGPQCRKCFYDVEEARACDSGSNRAIMCDTLEPVVAEGNVYDHRNIAEDSGSASAGVHEVKQSGEGKDYPISTNTVSLFREAAERPFTDDISRGNVCAFIAARAGEVEQWEVTVASIMEFIPGARVAIAVEKDAFFKMNRAVGRFPAVRVFRTPDAMTASLFADQYCGDGTRVIYYVRPKSVTSRPFTSKDTHSPAGDLLVVYSDPKSHHHDVDLAQLTTSVLGFEAPLFTLSTDLMLPAGANHDLRELLTSEADGNDDKHDDTGRTTLEDLARFNDTSAIPQVMAALQYSKDTPGIWFFNPEASVTQPLSETASIWDIPLLKPPFSCTFESLPYDPDFVDLAGILRQSFELFSRGGACENGIIAHESAMS